MHLFMLSFLKPRPALGGGTVILANFQEVHVENEKCIGRRDTNVSAL